MSDVIVNRVANSGLVSLDPESLYPKGDILVFDLKPYLFRELILKEKDFRESLKSLDWSVYQNQLVAITCTTDAIIPLWAYMLVTTYLQGVAHEIYVGSPEEMRKHVFLKNILALDISVYKDQRVIVKGCGDLPIESYAYAALTQILKPVVKSIMYGEACSNVPIYKKKAAE